MLSNSSLLFIPGLHKLAAPPSRTPANPSHPFCPSRHAVVNPPNPNPPARLTPSPRGSRFAPTTSIATPVPPATRSTLPAISTESRTGHKHTAESKRKISVANRGNIPWNKGLKHSEETRRKISEATRKAMLSPEMRERLKQRARGRRHSEATKLKIRETARASRNHAKQRKKKSPVPFVFSPDVVAQLNERVQGELETHYKENPDHPGRYMVRERRAMPEETRAKLSRRIKAMWMDPDYRSRVAEGIEQRQIKLAKDRTADHAPAAVKAKAERKPRVRRGSSSISGTDSPKRRVRSASKQRQSPRSRVVGEPSTGEQKVKEEEEVDDQGLDDSVLDQDIVLDTNALSGWTKEELGIFGSHDAGTVDTHVGASLNTGDFDEKPDLASQLGAASPKDFGRRADSMDSVELLRSLKDAEQFPAMSRDGVDEGTVDGFTRLAVPFEPRDDLPFGSLELRNSNANHTADKRDDAAFPGDSMDGFLDGPVDLMSTSAADLASPFLTMGSDADRLSSAPQDDFEFNSDDNLLGASASTGFLSNKFSVNYLDETLGGLDMYDDVGQTFDANPRSSPLFGFERQGGNFAGNSGKTK